MELRKRAMGIAIGLLMGLAMMLGTWWLLIFDSPGGVISSAQGFFIGYTYSWGGGIIGFFWGFVWGFSFFLIEPKKAEDVIAWG